MTDLELEQALLDSIDRRLTCFEKIASFFPESSAATNAIKSLALAKIGFDENKETYVRLARSLETSNFTDVLDLVQLVISDGLQTYLTDKVQEYLIGYFEKDTLPGMDKSVMLETVLDKLAADAAKFSADLIKSRLGADFKIRQGDVEVIKETFRPSLMQAINKLDGLTGPGNLGGPKGPTDP
jgi:hypothetical protein